MFYRVPEQDLHPLREFLKLSNILLIRPIGPTFGPLLETGVIERGAVRTPLDDCVIRACASSFLELGNFIFILSMAFYN